MSQPELYPLVFSPIFKYRIWGGEKLKTALKKKYEEDSIGESWEISNVAGDETLVRKGDLKGQSLKQLITNFGAAFLGKHVHEDYGTDFPLLIKFIDSKTPLSIQVHPHDELARERHDSFGKNEMWYIMAADDDADIYVGFNEQLNPETYKKHIENSTITSALNLISVKAGDTFHIPTGRVHAIGAGVLLAEIQQTSDITYRIYDYDRVDAKTGKTRDLHTKMALDAVDFEVLESYQTSYEITENESTHLVHTPYFKTNILDLNAQLTRDYSYLDSFVILICVSGSFMLTYKDYNYSVKYGQTILLPAALSEVVIEGKAKILEVNL